MLTWERWCPLVVAPLWSGADSVCTTERPCIWCKAIWQEFATWKRLWGPLSFQHYNRWGQVLSFKTTMLVPTGRGSSRTTCRRLESTGWTGLPVVQIWTPPSKECPAPLWPAPGRVAGAATASYYQPHSLHEEALCWVQREQRGSYSLLNWLKLQKHFFQWHCQFVICEIDPCHVKWFVTPKIAHGLKCIFGWFVYEMLNKITAQFNSNHSPSFGNMRESSSVP